MIKRFLIAFVLLVIVCGGIVGFNLFRDQMIRQYFATHAAAAGDGLDGRRRADDLEARARGDRHGRAARGVDLAVETAGIVQDILFQANDKVMPAGILVQLDDAVERADLAAAKAQAELAKTALSRRAGTAASGVSARTNDLDIAQAAAPRPARRWTSSRRCSNQKQLTAPFAGTVGIPQIDIGQYVEPGTVMAGRCRTSTSMRVDFSVPEQQIADAEDRPAGARSAPR